MSCKTFKSLDNYVEAHLAVGHPQPLRQTEEVGRPRYFGRFNKFRNDHGCSGTAASGAYLIKFAWTPIVRHQMVTGAASPDDPDLADYWAARRRRVKPPLDSYNLRLLTKQAGRCPSAVTTCSPPTSHPSPPGNGNAGG